MQGIGHFFVKGGEEKEEKKVSLAATYGDFLGAWQSQKSPSHKYLAYRKLSIDNNTFRGV